MKNNLCAPVATQFSQAIGRATRARSSLDLMKVLSSMHVSHGHACQIAYNEPGFSRVSTRVVPRTEGTGPLVFQLKHFFF